VIGKTVTSNGARTDETGPLPDFDLIAWPGRLAIIAFDANVTTNASVQAARHALETFLTRQGATVQLLTLPTLEGVNGVDDFIGRQGDRAFFSLLDHATSDTFVRAKKKDGSPGRILENSLDNVRLALARLHVRLRFNRFTQQLLLDD